jgi:hypothetical protein
VIVAAGPATAFPEIPDVLIRINDPRDGHLVEEAFGAADVPIYPADADPLTVEYGSRAGEIVRWAGVPFRPAGRSHSDCHGEQSATHRLSGWKEIHNVTTMDHRVCCGCRAPVIGIM